MYISKLIYRNIEIYKMIDWLDFTIELQHPTISHGRWCVVDENGEVLRESDTFRKVEGSFSSAINVSSTSAQSFYSDAMFELGLYQGIDNGFLSSAISFYGNPAKYLQGHNIIGTNCIRSLVCALVKDVLPKLGLSDFYVNQALQKVNDLDFWVTRIDITKMFDLGTNEDVEDYLYMMPLTVKARGDRCDYTKSTFYVGKHSTIWTAKFYNKYRELISKSKHHRLNPIFTDTNLLDFSKGKLRAELTLRKKQLDKLSLTYAKKLQPEINKLFNKFMGRMTMTNQRVNREKLSFLSPRYQSTYFRWRDGDNPKSFLTKSVFYRHKTALLEIGVDISKPPIMEENRRADIQSLTKVLAPKVVRWSDIPDDIMPYLVQPVKTNHLRVA